MNNFIYKLKIFFLRLISYEKPYRVAIVKYLSLKFKTFRPHYETILYESAREASKLGYKELSVLELGVAGGTGAAGNVKLGTVCDIEYADKLFNKA